LFRDEPRAFSTDAFSTGAVAPALRSRHSEDREGQALTGNLIERLGNVEWTRYAVAHKI
jgi:uncharacterized protein (DUF924 family)